MENFHACSRGLAKALIILIPGLVFGPTTFASPDDNPPDCRGRNQPTITDATTLQGTGAITINDKGTVLIAIDSTGNSQADVLYRIAPRQTQRVEKLLERKGSGARILLINERRADDYRELEVAGLSGNPTALLFVLDNRDCGSAVVDQEVIASTLRIPAKAIGSSSFQSSNQSILELLSSRMDDSVVNRQSEIVPDSVQPNSVLWCSSGGEGAEACSFSFGGIGPISTGECSVTCDYPDYYACCGPGLGKYCQCISPDTTTPSGPDDGDGGGTGGDSGDGDGGSGSGDGGSGGGSGGSDDGEDGDDEEEDDSGDEESYCVDC